MWTKKKSIYVYEGCTNYALHGGGGVCIRHGHGLSITIHTMNLLHLNPNSKDYRFSNPPNLRSARAAIRGQEGRSVPEEAEESLERSQDFVEVDKVKNAFALGVVLWKHVCHSTAFHDPGPTSRK
jgi:hypothetical protein